MAELSPSDQVRLSRITGDMMTLLLLDDAWTELAQQPDSWVMSTTMDPRGEIPPTRLEQITDEMQRLLQRMGEAAGFIGTLPERMGADLSARFDALMWGDGLSSADRDDLRWLVTRAGGVTGLAQSAAAALSNSSSEADDLQAKVTRMQSGETGWTAIAEGYRRATQWAPQGEASQGGESQGRESQGRESLGDLSKDYRCGLGSGLLVSGCAALPSAVGTGAAAAIAAGAAGAVAAGVIAGATGGVAAIAIIVAGLLVMRRAKC